jgi:DNA-binding response OmpR family regulator
MTIEGATTSEGHKRRVLIVEDDPSIMLGLRINLEAEGYAVQSAEDGERALALVRDEAPDLVILDIMLPKMNGLQVLQTLRREGHAMPIIVLSARTGEMDKVTGLELGAEDYVAKPFSLAELLARVRAALRRGHATSPRAFTFEDVLVCLIEARGVALSREAIFARVWGPNHHGTPRTIDNFIQQLRSKLEPDAGKPRYLVTVRGIGYRFDR